MQAVLLLLLVLLLVFHAVQLLLLLAFISYSRFKVCITSTACSNATCHLTCGTDLPGRCADFSETLKPHQCVDPTWWLGTNSWLDDGVDKPVVDPTTGTRVYAFGEANTDVVTIPHVWKFLNLVQPNAVALETTPRTLAISSSEIGAVHSCLFPIVLKLVDMQVNGQSRWEIRIPAG